MATDFNWILNPVPIKRSGSAHPTLVVGLHEQTSLFDPGPHLALAAYIMSIRNMHQAFDWVNSKFYIYFTLNITFQPPPYTNKLNISFEFLLLITIPVESLVILYEHCPIIPICMQNIVFPVYTNGGLCFSTVPGRDQRVRGNGQ